jgi:signal transduction histidine kinase
MSPALSDNKISKKALESISYSNGKSKKNRIYSDIDFSLTFGTYTNSKSIVNSYATVFETLWYQIDLHKQVVQVCKFLQTRDKNLQDFLNITAHEISNPLQSILGLSDILVSQNNLNRDYRTMLNAISNNATKLHMLSKNILDTARLERKSIRLQREDCDIINLVKSVIRDFKNEKKEIVPIKLILDEVQAMYKNKSNDSATNVSSPLSSSSSTSSLLPLSSLSSSNSLVVNIDPHRIAQVITNLLNNAVNFTSNGIIKIFIEIDKESDNIRIKVTDTGTGINRKYMSRLFAKYFSTSKKGSGLGLYICKNIVEQHGGRIWAENNKDGPGSTFTFTIPIN